MKEWSLWSSDNNQTWTQRLQHTVSYTSGKPVGPNEGYYTHGGQNYMIQSPLASPLAAYYWAMHITKWVICTTKTSDLLLV